MEYHVGDSVVILDNSNFIITNSKNADDIFQYSYSPEMKDAFTLEAVIVSIKYDYPPGKQLPNGIIQDGFRYRLEAVNPEKSYAINDWIWSNGMFCSKDHIPYFDIEDIWND